MKNKNVDWDNLDKFEQAADTWWDLEGSFHLIHRLNPLRLQYVIEQSQGIENKNVLDIGCGAGILSESMVKMGAKVTGIDISEKPLEIAIEHAKDQKLEISYLRTTIEEYAEQQLSLQEKGQRFDVITCMEMIEHVPDPKAIIAHSAKLLKPNGVMVFSTINRTLKAWAIVILGAEYVVRAVPKGTHSYENFIKPSELISWVEQEGLFCSDMCGYHYNPFTGRFWLDQDVSANYLITLKYPR